MRICKMFFSESEGTDINFSESEGTDIMLSESEGTDLDFMNAKSTIKRSGMTGLLCCLFISFSQISLANNAYLYATENNVYQGLVIDNDGNTQLVEGIINKNLFEGFVYETKSVDDGTGKTSEDESDYNFYSVDDGTGNMITSVDDGTGNNTSSVDDGTGNDTSSVDDGTGSQSVDDGTGDLITISMACNNKAQHLAQIQSAYSDEYMLIDAVHINGKQIGCNQK